MNPEQLAELRKLEKAATPFDFLPWSPVLYETVWGIEDSANQSERNRFDPFEDPPKERMVFIAALRNAAPQLLVAAERDWENSQDPGGYLAVGGFVSKIKEAEQERDRLKAALEHIANHAGSPGYVLVSIARAALEGGEGA